MAVEIKLRIIGSAPELAQQTQIAGELAVKNVAKPLQFGLRLASSTSDSKNGPVFAHSSIAHNTTLKTVCNRFDLIGILFPNRPFFH
jgi:hypothetical protein